MNQMRNALREKKRNFNNMKNAFLQSQINIEKKNTEESKKYFEKYISNTFLKEFEIENENGAGFKISLISLMQNFTQEFMNFCDKFINTFKSNTETIINQFDIKDNNPIEHINFIVIGRAGVGKSSFINESLLLSGLSKAKEGVGVSVTYESALYTSDKLKMIRMWDTQGLDYKVTQKIILNEIKRLVEICNKKGPDHYINIILYCTPGGEDRFQNEDGQLIHEIMQLYPLDNLPVIITQLQSYMKGKAKKMEKVIRNVLDNYLDHKIVEKIEIKSVVARDYQDEDKTYKAYGIPELLRLSFDIMGRSISSATCKNIIESIEKLCRNFIDKKILYVKNLFKYEMEILEIAKSLFVKNLDQEEEEEEDILLEEDNKIKELSEDNTYGKLENPNFFVDNFCKIMTDKFIEIFNNLESGNMNIEEKENEEENQNKNNNVEENKEQENNNENNNINENNQQENNIEMNNINEIVEKNNIQNENNQQEEENNDQNNNMEENQEQENEEENQDKDEPLIKLFIKKKLKKLRKSIDQSSNKAFEKIFKKRYNIYLDELRAEQSEKNREYRDNTNILDTYNAEKNFKEKLLPYFKNEYFKIFLCIILKLFMNNLNDILQKIVQKELKENDEVKKVINQKAEISLKNITEELKMNLNSELDTFMKAKQEENNKNKKPNEFNNEDVDFRF